MSQKTKIAFLYTEIAGYTVACLRKLSESADILVFRWPVNNEAPFLFEFPENVKVIDRQSLNENEIFQAINDFSPHAVICSGWMDKGYLKILKQIKRNICKIICIDNHWTGSVKQRIAQWVSPFYLKRIFTHAWVPGKPQLAFAEKLGFKNKTLQGFYCADVDLFNDLFTNTFPSKQNHFPKRILYLARYVEHKGIFELWNAFIKWQVNNPDWELWCVGAGEEWEHRIKHEKIKHLGFLQPNELKSVIEETGVYILPSKFEPWGVSVHEFAVAGFPLLISSEVGAGTYFCGVENSFIFEAASEDAILSSLDKLATLQTEELINMAKESHRIGMTNTPEIWANKLLKLISEHGKIGD